MNTVSSRLSTALIVALFVASSFFYLVACDRGMSIVSVTPSFALYRTFGNMPVQVRFDRRIDPSSVTPGSYFITEGTQEEAPILEGEREVDGKEIRFIPSQPLKFGVTYRIRLTQELRSEKGIVWNGTFPDVTYGNTEVPAPGDRFVVNIPDDFGDNEIGGAYSLMGYLPPLLGAGVPEQTDPAKPGLIPGIHASEAWKLSRGRPDVLVVILDNGLGSYNPKDLVDNLYLNRGELPLPRSADGKSIGGADPYDHNQDGRFNSRDYQGVYAYLPDGTLGPVQDLNADGTIDPGDLLLAYADGIDGYPADPQAPSDAGGLVDDVSGYDFFRQSPWAIGMKEFPEGIHGEGRATEVAAQADNGAGVPGACPNCTVMVCRITYALIEEGELLSHGIQYALDKGADVILAGLGSLSATAAEVAALDAADAAGVPVIVGMSDESSFHHSTPSVLNHVIATKCNYFGFVESYCTGYGGQVHFAANGMCGSTAAGLSGGAAGLLISRARDLGFCNISNPGDTSCKEPDLSANEVKQILSLTAEKPESEKSCQGILTDASCKLDTWDRHHGYGRLNLFRALARLETPSLPPERVIPPAAVQILAPGWFTPLNPSLPGAGDLSGTIRTRVPVDRVTCEWAPGIEPDEADFKGFACKQGDDGTLSARMPLLRMAASVGGATFTPDGPEGKAVTVRVRAYTGKRFGEDLSFGEDRRVFAIHRDPTWMEGFPVSLIDKDGDGKEDVSPAAENAFSIEGSPALADLDGNGTDELILCTSNGLLHVLEYSYADKAPREMDGYPIRFWRSESDSLHDGFGSAPAIGDIDNDGVPEIVVSTLGGYLYAFRGAGAAPLSSPDGKILTADAPDNTSAESYGAGNTFFGSPVLVDLTGDGYLDVVAGCSDQKVYAVDGLSIVQGAPALIAGWPVRPEDAGSCSQLASSILGTVAAADLTGDGVPEIIVGTSEECDDASGRLYALHPDGNLHEGGSVLAGFPVSIPPNPLGVSIPLPPLSTGVPSSPVAARMGDEVVIGAGTFLGTHVVVHVVPNHEPGATPPWTVSLDKLNGPTFGMAGSGAFLREERRGLSYAVPSVTFGPGGEHGVVGFINQVDLIPIETRAARTRRYPVEDYQFMSNPSFADVDGDGTAELIAVSGGHFVHAYPRIGEEPDGWPKFTYGWHMASPAFGDLDGDGMLEMVAPVREGRIFVWRTEGPACGNHPWPTFHHDNQRTGNLDTPLPGRVCQ